MSLSDQLWCPASAQVTVLQARGLRIKGKGGTNDAYAVMQVGKEKYQTSVVEKSVAPVWKEEATFDLPQQQQQGGGGGTERSTLHVHVLHRALVGPDKLLGQAVINLLQLSEDKTRNKTEWFKLLDKTGKADKDRGEVLVDIQFMRNNMTASMFDLSAAGKSRSRLGKFKDKVRGKKKESDAASTVVPSFTQVLTDSEEEGNGDAEAAAGKDEKKKKNKMKSLFSPKSNLQKNMSQSMSVLPGKNSPLSGSQSSGLNVDPSEGKKKFKFKIHKRSGSSDNKDSSASQQKHGTTEQSNLCINGSHVYCEEPPARTARIGSNFSLASSGHGSMEDVPDSSPPSVDSLRGVRQYSPWTEEEEEMAEVEDIKEDVEEERIKMEEEERRRQERRTIEEEEKRQREEEEMIRIEEEKAQEERRRQEEERRLAEEKRRLEEEQRRRNEEVRKEEEERIQREEEERRRREEAERARREEEERERLAEKRRLEEEERMRVEEEEKRQREEEERIRMEEERAKEERRKQEEEHKLAEEKKRLEEEERRRIEEEEVRRLEEQERRRIEEEERIRMEKEMAREQRRREEEENAKRQEEERKLAEQKRRLEEEERRQKEERISMEEELRRQEQEEKVKRQEEEHKLAEEKKRLEEEERSRIEEEEVRKEEEERIRREEEERRRQEEEELVRRLEEECGEKRRLEEQERKRKEEEERIKKEEEEKARREKEEYERLVEKRRKLEEEERKRIEAEEKIRKEEEERVRAEEDRKRKEEERRQEEEREKLAEEKRIIEEQERRIEEEERIRKEEERRHEEEERKRIVEEERIRQEEQEKIRMEKERRSREAEEEKIKMEEEEKARQLEKVTRNAEEQKKRENKTKQKVAGTTTSKVGSSAEVYSTNPFDEDFSNNPFDENPNSPAAPDSTAVSTVQQRSQPAVSSVGSKTSSADEKDLISSQREKRPAPQPPGRNQAEGQSQDGSTRHLVQVNKQSKDKDAKIVSVPPQRSVQMIAPLNRSPTDAKNTQSLAQSQGKRPAPSAPSEPKKALSSDGKIANKSSSEAKQEPIAYGLNPFEDDEDENDLIAQDTTGSIQGPPAVSQAADGDAASQAKIKSSKKARAPLLPATTAATSSTSINQNTEGGHDTGVTTHDDGLTHPCDPEEAPVQESQPAMAVAQEAGGKKEVPPVTSRRLQPVKPLNPLGQQPLSVAQGEMDNKSTGIHSEVQEKAKDTELKGPYSQLTREELISLVLKQDNQLSGRDKKISELELYIDNLLVRVMEESPSILMSMNSLKKTV
ncbi:uncharacterized protein [Pagrus major]|uniref:uncharacterized protein n=1 Tax=Pagrus major TaxID=143350 RepID=UPI003CC89894